MHINNVNRYISTIYNNNLTLVFYKGFCICVIDEINNNIFLENKELQKQSILEFIETNYKNYAVNRCVNIKKITDNIILK